MAFRYRTGVALNIPDFFTIIENVLQQAGWIHVSGTGTTTIVYRSTGEMGAFSKLYIRLARNAVNLDRIDYRVQDDAAGTHSTGTASMSYLDTPGVGDVPFSYWISANKDCIAIVVKDVATYTGIWLGALEPFSLSIGLNETMTFAAIGLHTEDGGRRNYARMLQRYVAGTWDYLCRYAAPYPSGFNFNALDTSRFLPGGYVLNTADNREIYGQPYLISANINTGMGLSSEDTLTSGITGATSNWVSFVNSFQVWCLLTGGIYPVGLETETNFNGTFVNIANNLDLYNQLTAWMTARGWVHAAAWHAGTYTWDEYWTSTGESGTDDIRVRMGCGPNSLYLAVVNQNSPGFVFRNRSYTILAGDYPMTGYFYGDKDWVGVALYYAGAWQNGGVGKIDTFYADPSTVSFEYKSACLVHSNASFTLGLLRTPDGTWATNGTYYPDPFATSSPNRVDGVTYVVWPTAVYHNLNPVGDYKYVKRVASAALVSGDTITVGAKVYTWLTNDGAIRTT